MTQTVKASFVAVSVPEGTEQEQAFAAANQAFALQVRSLAARFLDTTSDTMEVLTSGSTGKPKTLRPRKEQMINSARMTLQFLGLGPGSRALLCMPVEHIAGMMMVVRTLTGSLTLYTQKPSANPFLYALRNLDFAAITPMQAYCALQNPESLSCMRTCRQILIGGGFIDPKLEYELLHALPETRLWHSYGMTETLSHIALRRLTLNPDGTVHKPALFRPLPGVSLHLSESGTLCIHAPAVCEQELETHDLADLSPEGFVIRGRSDNIINSGALKLIPEEIEDKLSAVLSVPLAVSSRPSARYGEEAVLVTEEQVDEALLQQALKTLSRYERPKAVVVMPIPRTPTQKTDRRALRSVLREQYSSAAD